MPPNEDLNAKVAQQLESLKKKERKERKSQKQLCGQTRQTLVIVHKNHKKDVAVKKTLFCVIYSAMLMRSVLQFHANKMNESEL